MAFGKVMPAAVAVAVIGSGDAIATNGYGGNGVPEALLVALEERFVATGEPRDLTLIHASGQGDMGERGLNHLGHPGLLKRIIGGHFGLMPKISKLAIEEQVEAYNFPEGALVHLYRDIAAGHAGSLSKVGLGTFVDPRLEGGKVNARAVDDLVELVEFNDEEWLFYRAFPIDMALIRGTTADPEGNITMERETLTGENLSLAIAAKTSGGYVIAQVERLAQSGSLDAREIRVPGAMVDAVVVADAEHHPQTWSTDYNPSLSGEIRTPLSLIEPAPLDHRKVIARRAALELDAYSVVNVGVGLPDMVGGVVAEERVQDLVTMTVDPGVFGGVPLSGGDFGAAINPEALIDHGYSFDFIDGGGLDAVFLGVGEVDADGSVNVSRFGDRLAGCGGFINLTQATQHIVFMTTLTAGGLQTRIDDGALSITREGTVSKFVPEVSQVTFNGRRAAAEGRQVLFVTERAVFRLVEGGLSLAEIAPGIDPERDILPHIPFALVDNDDPAPMDPVIFQPGVMGLRDRLLDVGIVDRLSYDAADNTVFMDFSGMHITSERQIDEIVDAIDAFLQPLGRKVNSVVNYERFAVADELLTVYADAVRYVETTYYLSVSRYTTSGFLRLMLGRELTLRDLTDLSHQT